MVGRTVPFFWCQGFSPPWLRCVVSPLNHRSASVFQSHFQCSWSTWACVGASSPWEPLFLGGPVGKGSSRGKVSLCRWIPVVPELSLLAGLSAWMAQGGVPDLWGSLGRVFHLSPLSLEHLEPHAASLCVPLSPWSKEGLIILIHFLKP